jgi:signal transduction histidine kinase
MNEPNKSPKFLNLGKVATTRGREGAAAAIPPIALGGTKPIAQKHLSPQRMLAVLVAGIFLSEVVEMLIMYGFRRVRPLPEWVDFGLDSLIMIVVAFPLIYYYAFHELLSHIEQRKRSETLLSKVLESLPVGVFITDQNGAILHGNQASQEIWSGAHYVGKEQYGEYKAWWPESGQAVAPEEWASPRVLISGQAILDEEMEIECFDGIHKTILNSAVPILENGVIQGSIVVNRDITHRKQFELTLEKQNRDLQELREAESRQRQLAETLNEVSRALSQMLDFDKVLNTLVEFAMRLVPLDYTYVVVVESESNLNLRARSGYEGEAGLKLQMGDSIRLSDFPCLEQVMTTQESLLIPDTQTYPGWQTLITHASVGSWLGIPLAAGGQTIGVLALQNAEPDFFNTKHIGLAEGICAQASVAIQNAWLFEQVRAGHERLQSLSRRLVEVQESERRYIARELHDEASQSLTALKFGLRLLEQEVYHPENILPRVAELKQLTDGVLEELHRLAMGLRPASLDYLGLVVALEQLVKDSDQRYGIAVRFRATGFTDERRLPGHVETTIYRIAQEAVTNAVRYSNASNIDVILEQREQKTVIIIEDNGSGFDTGSIGKSGHLGLVGMQERAQMIGAALTIESEPGCGTIIVVEVPHGN